jgi:hypothetical protein
MLGGTKTIETISKPVEIDIMQPALPRAIEMTSPTWYVVSEARIANRCNQIPRVDADGNPELKEDGSPRLMRPKLCDQEDREHPEWPDNYSYFDRFIEEMREQNNGELVFVATTIGDYEVMSADMQEIKRWIKQVGEVIVYYREVTNAKTGNKETEAVVVPKEEAERKGFSLSQLIGGNKDD